MKPIVWRPGEGEAVHLGTAASTSFKAEGPDTGSSLSITENVLAPGFPGPVPHTHRHTFDIFYVLEGTIAFQLGNASIEAPAGAFVLVPPGIVHAFIIGTRVVPPPGSSTCRPRPGSNSI